jgi:hypothetical protein
MASNQNYENARKYRDEANYMTTLQLKEAQKASESFFDIDGLSCPVNIRLELLDGSERVISNHEIL